MHKVGMQRQQRTAAYAVCGLFLLGILAPVKAAAAPAYTPYANAVAAQTGLAVGTAENAVGAPDGQSASFAGLNGTLTLDMGDGEEGTNALKVYLGQVSVQATVQVEFLDDGQTVISQEQRSLFLDVNPSNQTFAYDWHSSGKAYRFVRITTLVGLGFGVDSVEALGFIGSSPTQDTDGDGIPDREDGDPLVFNETADDGGNNGGGGSGGGGSGGGGNSTTIIRTNTTTSGSGASQPVNTPPASGNDADGDQMGDDWERQHGLDPASKADALLDPDEDGLINLREYEYGTDPNNFDTDGDGMLDGWEVENGLNALVDDAAEDPDSDYVTNRGEFRFDIKPYRSDDIEALSARTKKAVPAAGSWWWVVLLAAAFVLLTAVTVRGLLTASASPTAKSNGWYRFRHSSFLALTRKRKN